MTDQPDHRSTVDPADLMELVRALQSEVETSHEQQVRASQELGYIVQATREFATHYEAVSRQPSTPDVTKAIRGGLAIGKVLQNRFGLVRAQAHLAAEAVASAVPYFATAAAAAHTMGNSFSIGSPCRTFTPPPFAPMSAMELYSVRLTQLDSTLGRVYRDAHGALYAHPDDPGRAALWQMRQVFDHFFQALAPDDLVRRSEHWVRKPDPTPLQVHREERIRYSAHRWVNDAGLRSLLLESTQETLRAYQRLQQAHERGLLDYDAAQSALAAVDEIIRRWVDAISPWPPVHGA